MADFSKLSPDAGTTILYCKDATARSQITDVYKVMGEMGAINYAKITNTGETQQSVTLTVDNGYIKFNGTASIGFNNILNSKIQLPVGNYKLSCKKISGTSTSDTRPEVAIDLYNSSGTLIGDNYAIQKLNQMGTTDISFSISDASNYIKLKTYINTGVALDNIVICPMIVADSVPTAIIEPYTATNKELTQICQKPVYTDITSAVRTAIGQTYTFEEAHMWEDSFSVVVEIWVHGITGGNIDFNLTGIIPPSKYKKAGVIAPRNGNPAGLTWMNANEAILCNRFSTSVDINGTYIIQIRYYK